jgi:transcriptional repressor NrdR
MAFFRPACVRRVSRARPPCAGRVARATRSLGRFIAAPTTRSRLLCPFCNRDNDKVIDSRASDGGRVIRRRRQCLECKKRFTTYERVEQTAKLVVIKRDGSRVPFARENILKGILAACGKRPIAAEVKERLVDEVEEELHREFDREVKAEVIGDRVMRRLLEVDEVAFLRYASEYHRVGSVEDIRRQLDEIAARVKDVKDQQKLF